MKQWARLHRIRQIEEDQARMTVESAVAILRQTEGAVRRALLAEREARARRNAALAETESEMGAATGQWIQWAMEESEAQINRVLAVRRARIIPQLENQIEPARATYLEQRRERQKVETLLTNALEAERIESQRKSSAAIEDLFRGRRWYQGMRNREGER